MSSDLHGADLNGSDLRQADLTGADLTGANLNGALRGRRGFLLKCGTGERSAQAAPTRGFPPTRAAEVLRGRLCAGRSHQLITTGRPPAEAVCGPSRGGPGRPARTSGNHEGPGTVRCRALRLCC
ncbi:pentapeptide repeat-containing protein [Streptomyces nojiriensis]|uniref:pentapeptide repeat-containing protein n=1 Tax=Streptomyces nojiriensis TaxID=66374 RepID=UPI0035DF687F